MSDTKICGMDFEEYLIAMEEFHGARSPGMLVGGLMIDLALRELGPSPYLNVVTETRLCVSDAVQLATPCTMGNGYLQVLDWGIFAITAYDRKTLDGVRVGLDYERMKQYPMINSWFDRSARAGEIEILPRSVPVGPRQVCARGGDARFRRYRCRGPGGRGEDPDLQEG